MDIDRRSLLVTAALTATASRGRAQAEPDVIALWPGTPPGCPGNWPPGSVMGGQSGCRVSACRGGCRGRHQRPADLDAINVLASPSASTPVDPSIAGRVAASPSSPSPQSVPIDPSIAARASVMANPPVGSGATAQVYAADPGAAQRAALYRQLNPTGSPIGVPPAAASAMANPPSTAVAPPPAMEVQAPDGSVISFPAGMSQDQALAVMRQKYPPAANAGGNPYAQFAQPAKGGWRSWAASLPRQPQSAASALPTVSPPK